jgi:hypothetical protein
MSRKVITTEARAPIVAYNGKNWPILKKKIMWICPS